MATFGSSQVFTQSQYPTEKLTISSSRVTSGAVSSTCLSSEPMAGGASPGSASSLLSHKSSLWRAFAGTISLICCQALSSRTISGCWQSDTPTWWTWNFWKFHSRRGSPFTLSHAQSVSIPCPSGSIRKRQWRRRLGQARHWIRESSPRLQRAIQMTRRVSISRFIEPAYDSHYLKAGDEEQDGDTNLLACIYN